MKITIKNATAIHIDGDEITVELDITKGSIEYHKESSFTPRPKQFFRNKHTAEIVLKYMNEILDNYGVVTRADLYDLVGKVASYEDNKSGWIDLSNAFIYGSEGRYALILPKEVPLT